MRRPDETLAIDNGGPECGRAAVPAKPNDASTGLIPRVVRGPAGEGAVGLTVRAVRRYAPDRNRESFVHTFHRLVSHRTGGLSKGYSWWFSIRVLTMKIPVGCRETNVEKGREHLDSYGFSPSTLVVAGIGTVGSNRWRSNVRRPAGRRGMRDNFPPQLFADDFMRAAGESR